MTETELLDRISTNPKVMVGKPVIRGTRLTVEYVLNRLGHGSTIEELLEEYHGLRREDIQGCCVFASKALSDFSFVPLFEESE